ncbi:MAG: hypothetical protein D3924_13985 [Candidatus Electrothrix sp. AR4]|nr:hypothetical protein [Candidatus Electrothrix sp. AR4]
MLSFGQRLGTLFNVFFCSCDDALNALVIKLSDALPEIGPLAIGVVEEIRITAVVRAVLAGVWDLLG